MASIDCLCDVAFGSLSGFRRVFVLKGDDLKFWVEQGQSSAFKMNRLTPIECIIYVLLVVICEKKQAKKDGNYCSCLFCEGFFVQSHY